MDLNLVEINGALYSSRVKKSDELLGKIRDLIANDPLSNLIDRIYKADLYYHYSDSMAVYNAGEEIEAELREKASKFPQDENILLMGLSPISRDKFIEHYSEDQESILFYIKELKEVRKRLHSNQLFKFWRNGNTIKDVKRFVEFTNMVKEIFPLIKERHVHVKAATGLTRRAANELHKALGRDYLTPIAVHPDTEEKLTNLELFFSKHRESMKNITGDGSIIFEGVTVSMLNHNVPSIKDVFEVSFNTKHMFF